MGLETGVTFITDLVATNPASGDTRTEGDDHIRNIKTAVQGSFANFTGEAVTSTEAELNILDGVTSSAAELNILDGATLTVTELNRLDGSIGNANASSVQATFGLYGGYIDANAAAERLPSGWSVVKGSTGTYTVTHNLGLSNANDLNISVNVLTAGQDRFAAIKSTATNSFTINIFDVTGLSPSLEDDDWHFTAIDRSA